MVSNGKFHATVNTSMTNGRFSSMSGSSATRWRRCDFYDLRIGSMFRFR
jgi:hypothetical protein